VSPHAKKRFLAPDAEPLSDATRFAESLYKIPVLLTTWTRCGKPRCRCREGHLHGPYHALHWRDGIIQRRRYVRSADVPAVRGILEERRAQRQREQLVLALSLRSWRELSAWVAEVEARLREQEEQP
jgi:hypothetical protein